MRSDLRSARRAAAVSLLLALLSASCTNVGAETSSDPASTKPTPSPTKTHEPPPGASELPPSSFERNNPVIAGFVPRSVAFLDAQVGVIGGRIECPDTCEARGTGVIATTDDGGETWQVAAITRDSVTHLTVVPGTDELWATTSTCMTSTDGCGRALMHSKDAGLSWETIETALIDPTFGSPETGFALTGRAAEGGGAAELAVSRDGGQTWDNIEGPCGNPHGLTAAVSFPEPSHGWALCTSEDTGGKTLYETSGGGGAWVSRATSEGQNGCCLPSRGSGPGLSMFDDGTGYLWASGARSYLLRTEDGGKTWEQPWRGRGDAEFVDASWLDARTGSAIKLGGLRRWNLLKTSDGGETWESTGAW